MTAPQLFADHGCPFGHRVSALLNHLGVDFELHESSVGFKPAGLEAYSPSKRIPLMEHDGLVLTESRVILEYLAERFGYEHAFPRGPVARAKHRLAGVLVDEYVTPHVFQPHTPDDPTRFAEALHLFEEVLVMSEQPTLFMFTIAPIWRQLCWREDGFAARAIRGRAEFASKLDDLSEHPAIAATAPDFNRVRKDVRFAIAQGLIGVEAI